MDEPKPVVRTADRILYTIVDPFTDMQKHLYRCSECKALLLDQEDARAHLWWHDKLTSK